MTIILQRRSMWPDNNSGRQSPLRISDIAPNNWLSCMLLKFTTYRYPKLTVTPGTPCTPAIPAGPRSPGGPAAPASPAYPVSPRSPLAAVRPLGPGVPRAPRSPLFPSLPRSPARPRGPALPYGKYSVVKGGMHEELIIFKISIPTWFA